MGMGLLIGVWVARYLGPEQFGKLNYGQAYIAIFAVLVNLGLDTTLVKELVSQPAKQNKLIGTSFILRVAGALLAIMLAVLVSYISDYKQDQTSFIIIAILSTGMLFQAVDVVELYLQSHLQSKVSVILKNIAYILSSAFKVYLLLYGYGLLYFALAIVIDLGLAAIFLAAYTQSKLPIHFGKWQFDKVMARSLLTDSWPLIVSALAVILYMRMDQLMLKYMLGSAAVGNYSAAVRITEIFFFVPMIITNSVFPTLVKAREQNNLYHAKLIRLYSVLLYLSLSMAIAISLLSSFIIYTLYGEQYQDAAGVLQIHIWSSIFVYLGVASNQQLVIENKSKVTLYRTFIGLTVNLSLNIILIPLYGVIGAAIGTMISYASSSFLSNFLFKSTFHINVLYFKSIFPLRKINNEPDDQQI
ncbi:O-unit flippase [Pontibacter amylolyticus]|uniref:O-unit flippase n=2 Tax=Pontibacter amylolyticus TaxID=1424080 RepID=A0ABQ1WD71_9BACT|nr:O-unit flippase [Pontibacter amylolyticus]